MQLRRYCSKTGIAQCNCEGTSCSKRGIVECNCEGTVQREMLQNEISKALFKERCCRMKLRRHCSKRGVAERNCKGTVQREMLQNAIAKALFKERCCRMQLRRSVPLPLLCSLLHLQCRRLQTCSCIEIPDHKRRVHILERV